MAERIASQHVGINSPRWDEIFDVFCDLYLHYIVQDVVQILATKHDFKTTKSICDRKISQWQKRLDGPRLPMKYEKTFPDRSTAPSMTSAFPLDDLNVPLPSIRGLFGDAANTSYYGNIPIGIQKPDVPAKTLRKQSSYGRSSKRTTDFVSHSIIDSETRVDCITNRSLGLEINQASTIDHGKPRVTNRTTQRICLSYDQGWEWLGMTGDAPEARTFALVHRIEEALKLFKRDENFMTLLSSLLKQISPAELFNFSEYLWIQCPNGEAKTDDIDSRVADFKKDVGEQRWLENGNLAPSIQDPEAYNAKLVTWNSDLDWIGGINWLNCSGPLEFWGNENWSNISTRENSETIDNNKHIYQDMTTLMDLREEIWSNIESTCSSTFGLTKSELENAQRLIQQLETTYKDEPRDQQSCQIIYIIWTTLNDQLEESAMVTDIGTENEPSWDFVHDAPPPKCLVSCCCCGASPYSSDIQLGCIEAPCNHRFCPHCIYEWDRMNR